MITRLQQVAELLRQEDIEELISIGAPNDEYDSEARIITQRIAASEGRSPTGKISTHEVFGIAASVWREMFDLTDEELRFRNEAFEEIAKRIAP